MSCFEPLPRFLDAKKFWFSVNFLLYFRIFLFFFSLQAEQTKLLLEGELKRAKQDLETSKSSSSFKLAKITAELAEMKKDRDTIKAQAEEEKLSKDSEIGSLKKKMATLEKAGLNAKKMNELKQSYTDRISRESLSNKSIRKK